MSVIFLWRFDFKLLEQWFSTRGNFVSQETFGIVWGHFFIVTTKQRVWGRVGEMVYWHLVDGGQGRC